jgi:nitrite reductase/ring-hydroxylating ferredoxin subunit/DMSO/TMAO reductase YedYZ heme-binding membrane subunit
MSVRYIAVNWNRQKRLYDAVLVLGLLLSIGTFAGVTAMAFPTATAETMVIRGLGFTGFLLLQLIVLIGPLARLDPRFLPLLYNRRHLGVAMALIAVAHATFAILQYHAFGNLPPLESVLISNPDLGRLSGFPFEYFGIVALVIVVLMAATSHDFWLSALRPPAWKALHMSVYVAYAALVAHVTLGFLQDERRAFFALVLGALALVTVALHLVAGRREAGRDRAVPAREGWVTVCVAREIPDGRAKIGMVGPERVAVFRHDDKLSAVSNVCRHQNGPLGEGRIIDGCITCPWHGYQYRPETGTSPPPFDDRIATYDLAVVEGHVLVRERPNPPGTPVEPIPIHEPAGGVATAPFYVGYAGRAPGPTARFVRHAIVAILVLAVGLDVGFAVNQRSYDASGFEFGTLTTVEGTVRTKPYPLIEVPRPGPAGSVSRYLLAAQGKHGAVLATAGQDGKTLRIRGSFAYRDNLALLEIADLEARPPLAAHRPEAPVKDHGSWQLTGEIVDSKCYIGVMNPGHGKTHRGCAARCLSGGLTPLFVVAGRDDLPFELVLTTDRGDPFPDAGRAAGKPVALTGRILQQGDLWLLRADPRTLQDLP